MIGWKMLIAIILVLSLSSAVLPLSQSLSINHAGAVGRPLPPQNVEAVPGHDCVDLSWEEPIDAGQSPISGYFIYLVQDFNWVGNYPDSIDPFAIVGPEARSYRHSNLYTNQVYVYYMKAENANGLSDYSKWVWATPGRTVPGAPELNGRIGDEKTILSWVPYDAGGTSVRGFNVYRGLSATNMTMVGTTEGWSSYSGETFGQTTFTDTGLVNEVTYFYSVTTFNSMGESQRSNVVSIRPLLAPSNLTAFPPQVDHCEGVDIVVNWTFPAEVLPQIEAFRVIPTHAPPVIVSKQNTSHTVHVSGGWGYGFTVSAIYSDGSESYSDSLFVGAPMCEGYGFGFDLFLLFIVFPVFIGITLIILVIILIQRRKRKG
jgi:hypothetical protein